MKDRVFETIHQAGSALIRGAACLLVCCIFGVFLSIGALAATTQEKLESAKKRAGETQSAISENQQTIENISGTKSALEGKLGDLNDKLSSVTAELSSLDGQISDKQADIARAGEKLDAATDRLNTAEAELAGVRESLEDTKQELAEVTADLEQAGADLEQARKVQAEQYASMKTQVKFLYERGGNYYLEILLDSGSYAEFLNRRSYIRQLSDYNEGKLAEYRETARGIQEKQAVLETRQQEIARKKAQIEAKEADIEARQQAIRAQQAQIASEKSGLEAQEEELERLQSDQQAKQDEVSGLVSQTAEAVQAAGEDLAAAQSSASALEAQLDRQNSEISALQKQLEEEKRLQAASDASVWRSVSEVSVADSDRYLLANLIYCEAGNQPYEGQVGVGAVVMNRVRSGAFPNTISGVIYQSGQFSPASSGRLAVALAKNSATDSCYRAADAAMAGTTTVGECLFFRTPVRGVTAKYTIGGHIFY